MNKKLFLYPLSPIYKKVVLVSSFAHWEKKLWSTLDMKSYMPPLLHDLLTH